MNRVQRFIPFLFLYLPILFIWHKSAGISILSLASRINRGAILPVSCQCMPDFAGPDQIKCVFPAQPSVLIGCAAVASDPGCAGICYTWQPANGLNTADLTNPNPSVNPTTTTTYTAHVIDKFSGTDLGDYQVTVFVADIDMRIYKPKVITGNTTTLANQTIGSQTFENLDNDDRDKFFDNASTETNVLGGDDELVKLEISVNPKPWSPSVTVQIKESNGSNDILVWYDETKASPYILGSDLVLSSTVGGANLKKTLWVEGVKATITDKAQLELYYNGVPAPCDKAYLTILGVEKLTWEGVGGNSANDNNVLDTDPNLTGTDAPGGWPGGVRIFPDARLPDYTLPKRSSSLKIELSTNPIEPVKLFVKSFDVDDPLNEPGNGPSGNSNFDPSPLGFVDPNDKTPDPGFYDGTNNGATYTKDEDNRTTFTKSGVLKSIDSNGNPVSGNPIAVEFKPSSKIAQVTLESISLNPGDNYRVAVNGDADFMENLRNEDRLDKYAIVDKYVSPQKGAYPNQVQKPSQYLSLLLTIWRFLNIEFDSMEGFSDDDNLFSKEIEFTDFDGLALNPSDPISSTSINKLIGPGLTPYYYDWKPGGGLQNSVDYSPNLSTPGCNANGRFQNGKVKIYTSAGVIDSPITGNGDDFIASLSPINLSDVKCSLNPINSGVPMLEATLSRVLKNTTSEYIWELKPGSFTLPTGMSLNDYDGIKLEPYISFQNIISANSSTLSVTTNSIVISARVFDDDQRSSSRLLPYEDKNISGPEFAFRKTCVLPKLLADSPTNPIINTSDVPFDPNQASKPSNTNEEIDWIRNSKNYTFINHFEMLSNGNPNPYFWIAYLCAVWQNDTKSDRDPYPKSCIEEDPLLGLTHDGANSYSKPERVSDVTLVKGANMSFIYRETIADGGQKNKESRIIVHEIGHQFGLGHGDVETTPVPEFPNRMGLMTLDAGSINFEPTFNPRCQNLIRSRINPPGY